MTSRYEVGYWHRLLIEVDDDRAIAEIDVQLAGHGAAHSAPSRLLAHYIAAGVGSVD